MRRFDNGSGSSHSDSESLGGGGVCLDLASCGQPALRRCSRSRNRIGAAPIAGLVIGGAIAANARQEEGFWLSLWLFALPLGMLGSLVALAGMRLIGIAFTRPIPLDMDLIIGIAFAASLTLALVTGLNARGWSE
jgi:hypothetical protein